LESNWRRGIYDIWPAGTRGWGGRSLRHENTGVRLELVGSPGLQFWDLNRSGDLLFQTGFISNAFWWGAFRDLTFWVGPEFG